MAKAEEDKQDGIPKEESSDRERAQGQMENISISNHIDGKPHFVYSWKLESTDKLPKSKKPCLSLRKLEKQVNTDLDLLVNIVDVSVFEGLV